MRNPLEILQLLLLPTGGDGILLIWAKQLLVALVVFGLFWVASQIIGQVALKWSDRLAKQDRRSLASHLVMRCSPLITSLFTVYGAFVAVRTLTIAPAADRWLSGGLFVATVVIGCLILYRMHHELLVAYSDLTPEGKGVVSRQLVPVIEKLVLLCIITTALIIVLRYFGYDIWSLVTALGIGSLALGMAAKESLSHIISGFTLLFDRPFRIGDRIQLSSGQIGDVQDIGLRSTRVKTLDNQLIIIPNSDLTNTTVTNQAFPDKRVRGKIAVGVAYDSNPDQVLALLVDLAHQTDGVLTDPAPEAYLSSLGDSALQMIVFFWVDEYAKLLSVTDRINRSILIRFRQEGITIPFPTQTVLVHHDQNHHP